MMKRYRKYIAYVIMLLAGTGILAANSFAHHLWVQENENNYTVCRGHIGKEPQPYDPSCVKQITALDADGKIIQIVRTDEKDQAVFTAEAKPALVSVISEWGDRVQTTRGKKLMGRQAAEAQGFRVLKAFTSTQYSKTFQTPSGENSQARGLKFELVPVSDPLTTVPGAPLVFQLLFDGKPLADAAVFTNHDSDLKTGADGMVGFSFEKGVQLLYAIHKVPAQKDSGLDFLKFMTFVIFEVK